MWHGEKKNTHKTNKKQRSGDGWSQDGGYLCREEIVTGDAWVGGLTSVVLALSFFFG